MAIMLKLFYNIDMVKGFYDDIDALKRFNRALCDEAFYGERGYSDISALPQDVAELALPVFSPVQFIDVSSRMLLDIGCGSGIDLVYAAKAFPRCTVIGIDTSLPLLAVASRAAGRNCLKADAVRTPFKDGVFDGALLNGVFNTIADRGALLAEIVRITNRNGFVFIADIFKKKRHLVMPEGGELLNITRAMSLRELFLFLRQRGFMYEKGKFEPGYTKDLGIFAVSFRKSQ